MSDEGPTGQLKVEVSKGAENLSQTLSQGTVAVVGAGIIGLCCALALQKKGYQVTLLDPNAPGSQTSFGNAGGVAVSEVIPLSMPGILLKAPWWLLDPAGPLYIRWRHLPALLPWFWQFIRAGSKAKIQHIVPVLRHLLAPVYQDLQPLLKEAGVEGLLHKGGALTLYQKRRSYQQAAAEWALKRQQGIRFEPVSHEQIRQLEPGLAPAFHCGVRLLDWGHIDDPQQLSEALFNRFTQCGGDYQAAAVTGFCQQEEGTASVCLDNGVTIKADKTVIAAGVWSRPLLKQLGCSVSLESERGYHVTFGQPAAQLNNMIICAEAKCVVTPMKMGLRIAGTAEFSGLSAPENPKRSAALIKQAKTLFPGLNLEQSTCWSGHRPATPDSLPVISAVPNHPNVYCAFGHGHLGLTLGPTTGRLLADLITDSVNSEDRDCLNALRINRPGVGGL